MPIIAALLVFFVGYSSVEARPRISSFNPLPGFPRSEIGTPKTLPGLDVILSLARPLSSEEIKTARFSYCNKLLTLIPHEVFTLNIPNENCLIYLMAPGGYLLEQRTHPLTFFSSCEQEQLLVSSGTDDFAYCDGSYTLNLHGDHDYVGILYEGARGYYSRAITLVVSLKPKNTNWPGSTYLESGSTQIVWRDPEIIVTQPRPILELARLNRNLQICPETCGSSSETGTYSVSSRIPAEEKDFPFMAQIVTSYETRSGQVESKVITCAGTILNSRNILTSAQCLLDGTLQNWRVADRFAIFGTVGRGLGIDFDDFVVHPKYKANLHNPETKIRESYDIAVIRLPEDIKLGPNRWPICLAPPVDFTNNHATIAGFGGYGLWRSGVTIADYDKRCKKLDGSKIPNMHKKICTYGLKKEKPCRDDVGSPVAVSEDSVWYQVGVDIAGYCGSAGDPSFQVNVTSFISFIKGSVEGGQCTIGED